MEQNCCCCYSISLLISACSYYTDLLVEVVVLAFLHMDCISAKGKVKEICFPYLPKMALFSSCGRCDSSTFFSIWLSVLANNLKETEFTLTKTSLTPENLTLKVIQCTIIWIWLKKHKGFLDCLSKLLNFFLDISLIEKQTHNLLAGISKKLCRDTCYERYFINA